MMSLPPKKGLLHTYVEVHAKGEYTRAYVTKVMPKRNEIEVRWEAAEDTGWEETVSTLTLDHHWVGMHADQTTPFNRKRKRKTN